MFDALFDNLPDFFNGVEICRKSKNRSRKPDTPDSRIENNLSIIQGCHWEQARKENGGR
jgi:hypothetical protein